MKNWLLQARKNWDAFLAFFLCYVAIAMWLGPGYYFLIWWTVGSLYILKLALEIPKPPNRR